MTKARTRSRWRRPATRSFVELTGRERWATTLERGLWAKQGPGGRCVERTCVATLEAHDICLYCEYGDNLPPPPSIFSGLWPEKCSGRWGCPALSAPEWKNRVCDACPTKKRKLSPTDDRSSK